jgi:carbamoyltransferase
MYFLGLSALAHNTAAALLNGSEIVAAIEESKLTRSRSANGIPRVAIRFCMEQARIDWQDISAIAVANRPWRTWTRRTACHSRFFLGAPISSAYYESKAIGELATELNNHRILRTMLQNPKAPVLAFDHHLCHAASAFYASGYDRALIVTSDEQGGGQSGSIALAEEGAIRVLQPISCNDSLAWLYSQVTELLGFLPHEHEHKTQWLAAKGEPRYLDVFRRIIRQNDKPHPRLNPSYFKRGFAGRLAFSKLFYDELGITSGDLKELPPKSRAEIASSIQKATELVFLEILNALRKKYSGDNLCLSGGLFLNPLLVSAIENDAGYENVFVQPAPGNEGTALGAAYLALRKIERAPHTPALSQMYFGPDFINEEIKAVLDNCKASYRWLSSEEEIIRNTIKLLLSGKIIGWFQGRAEFGPRALGNRSLLASPWASYVKENLNDYVKHREPFRPFALSIPTEDAARYFEPSRSAEFMASMSKLRAEGAALLSPFAVCGNFVRLHLVKREVNPLYWSLLKSFGTQAPAPLLLNASFNLFGEPLVISPRDAVRSYFCSGTDALMIGSFMLSKF